MAGGAKALWRCPRCGHRFVTRNLWHACGNYRLADHFTGKPPILRRVFQRWLALARASGPVTVYAQKTRIVFQRRVRFGGAVIRRDWVDAGLWLARRASHPRLQRTESFGRLGYGLHFELRAPEDIDAALGALMAEAYHRAAAPAGEGRRARPGGRGKAAGARRP
jgi:hypothetical protein